MLEKLILVFDEERVSIMGAAPLVSQSIRATPQLILTS
jgi:hypothetical protein